MLKIGLGLGVSFLPQGLIVALTLAQQVAALFAASEPGYWYDPSDFPTMFQDSGGTTPVTAVGQPVGLLLDKSGRGNHLSQPISADRPVLAVDGNGHYYLQGNGTNMHMDGVLTVSGSVASVAFGVQKSGTGLQVFCEAGDPAFPINSFGIYASQTSADLAFYLYQSNVAFGGNNASPVTALAPVVGTVVFDRTAGAVAQQIVATVNNAAPTTTTLSGTPVAGAFTTDFIAILGRRSGGNYSAAGFYGMIGRYAATSPAQLSTMRDYINSKTGGY